MLNLKYYIVTIMLFAVCTVNAQTKKADSQPDYYVNSTKLNRAYFPYIKSDYIQEIHVIKNDADHPNGVIYVTLKDEEMVGKILSDKLMSIKDILLKKGLKINKNKPAIYVWDSKLLTDTANVRVPESFLVSVEVTPAANMPYFKTAMPNTSVVTVLTRRADAEVSVRGR